jgi:xanthine dehydrogenase molybdenum-binding subunit
MAADVLCIPDTWVRTISTQDTDVSPFDPGAFASRQSYTVGPAILEAATLLKEKIIAHAALMSGQPARNLVIRDGKVVYSSRPDYVLYEMSQVVMDAYYNQNQGQPLFAEASHKTRTNPASFGCTFVEVEVDIPLCKVTIKDILNLHDSGRILNPQTAEGQVHGGMGMAIGGALFEEMLIDAKTGIVLNDNLLDYKFPTILDLPDLHCSFVETHEPQSAFGNKSLGEPPIISPGPALRNAIWMATGVKIDELPITPKRLYEHLARAGLI